MPWFRVDDGFANSKPVLRIPRRYRTAAVGLWTLAGTWAAKELTDGFVPDYVLDDLSSTAAMAGQLVTSGLWETAVKDGVTGWQFVGWSTYQPTKAEVLERRAAEAEKKRLAREAAKRTRDQQQQKMSPRDSHGDTSGSPDTVPSGVRSTRPDPSRPVPPVETLGGEGTLVDADPEPPRFCVDHPEDTAEPCIPCKKARTVHKAWVDRGPERQRQQAKSRADAQRNCVRCRGENSYEDDQGHVHPCRTHVAPHQEVVNQ